MSLSDQIARYMSLREPQTESRQVLHEIADGLEFRTTSLQAVGLKASEKSRLSSLGFYSPPVLVRSLPV